MIGYEMGLKPTCSHRGLWQPIHGILISQPSMVSWKLETGNDRKPLYFIGKSLGFPQIFPKPMPSEVSPPPEVGKGNLSIGRSPTLHHFSNGYHLIPSTTVISWRNFRWNHGCGMDQRLWNTKWLLYWIILDHIGYLFHIFPGLFHMVIASDCPGTAPPQVPSCWQFLKTTT